MSHRLNPRRPSWLPELVAIAAAIASALFLVLYGPPAIGAVRTEASVVDRQAPSGASRNRVDRERRLGSHDAKRAARLPDAQVLQVGVLDIDLGGEPCPTRARPASA